MKMWIRPFIVLVIAFISMSGALFVTHPTLILMFWFSPLVIILGYILTGLDQGMSEEEISNLFEQHKRKKEQEDIDYHISKSFEALCKSKMKEVQDEWRRIVEEDGKRDK